MQFWNEFVLVLFFFIRVISTKYAKNKSSPHNYMARIQKTGQFGSICIGNPLDFWKWALKSKFSRNSNSKVGKFKCHPNSSQLGKIFSEGKFLFSYSLVRFNFQKTFWETLSCDSYLPMCFFTWLQTQGRLLTFFTLK